ncbi:hypothetical protein [Klebsiella aerogenes]|uniref:hypothetical protein n=1 Tax=Klebsiella aerogenes TaxID=548 RepID=UPI001865F3C5|nr:hypothetical protein [Klebsiella aerogenes]
MENVNQPVMDNEISVADFASIFDEGGVFADETPVEKESNELEGLTFKDDYGNELETDDLYQVDALDDESMPIDNLIEQATQLGNVVNIGGVQYQKEDVEKAVEMHSKIEMFASEVDAHFAELEDYEHNMNELYSISRGQIDEYIIYYENILNNERISPQDRVDAHKQLQDYKGQLAQMEMQYKKTFAQNQAAKERAEKLKGRAVANQLIAKGWKQKDFEMLSGYLSANNLSIPFGQANDALFIAIRKAAMFDEKESKAKDELSNTVGRAIAGKPARASKNITPEAERRNARAKALAEAGDLSPEQMFNFIKD